MDAMLAGGRQRGEVVVVGVEDEAEWGLGVCLGDGMSVCGGGMVQVYSHGADERTLRSKAGAGEGGGEVAAGAGLRS